MMSTRICLACDWCGVRSVHAQCVSGKVARNSIMKVTQWQTMGGDDLCPDCVWVYEQENNNG